MNRRHITLLPVFLALLLTWRFGHDFRDVLEAQAALGSGSWMEVPGPYRLAPAGDGGWIYVVEIPSESARSLFFRVRREWGTPDVGPVLPD